MLDQVHKGDPLTAARHNREIDAINRLMQSGTTAGSDQGMIGANLIDIPRTLLCLFELTTDFTYPDTATAATDHFDQEPTPYASAQLLWCNKFRTLDEYRGYDTLAQGKTEKIYYSACPRDANGYGIGDAPATTGDAVWAVYNDQSGRFELIKDSIRLTCCSAYGSDPSAAFYEATWTLVPMSDWNSREVAGGAVMSSDDYSLSNNRIVFARTGMYLASYSLTIAGQDYDSDLLAVQARLMIGDDAIVAPSLIPGTLTSGHGHISSGMVGGAHLSLALPIALTAVGKALSLWAWWQQEGTGAFGVGVSNSEVGLMRISDLP